MPQSPQDFLKNDPLPDPATTEMAEEGYPLPEPMIEGTLPAGGGKLVLPHYTTFSQIVNLASRTYRWSFDEALRHSQSNSLAIRRDPTIMDALRSRQLPTAQLPWHLDPVNDQDTKEQDAAKIITDILNDIPNFQQYRMHLLEAIWYGRYGVQNVFRWDWSTGQRLMKLVDYRPINGDKLIFRYTGETGVLVHSTYKGSWMLTDRGRAHLLDPNEREQVVIHKHEPEDADFFEGELAGAVHGVGIRSRLYWFWYLRTQVTAWLMDFLERVGAGGTTVYYYEHGNSRSLSEVKQAAETQWRNNSILFPRYRDGSTGGPGIDRLEPSRAGADLLRALIVEYFDEVIRRYILGQTLTQEPGPVGFGSALADLHGDTFSRIIKYDAINLQETITKDLVKVLYKYVAPGVPCSRFKFDVDKPNAKETLEAAKAFYEMGGAVDEEQLRSIIGLSEPTEGHNLLTNIPSVSAAGVGALPQGVPIQGQPGPEQQGEEPEVFHRRGQKVRLARSFSDTVSKHAEGYSKEFGLPYDPTPLEYKPLNKEHGQRVAQTYESLSHDPNNPNVRQSYDKFKSETENQFHYLRSHGVTFEPWRQEGQPYQNSQEMVNDARGGHLYVFTGGDFPNDHPLVQPTDYESHGHRWTYNDMFRGVHDYFGHSLYGNEFGPRGEEHAFQTHRRMYSPGAQPAMAMETKGHNSWVNFGPHSYLPVTQRPFAEQKANVLDPSLFDPESPVKMERQKTLFGEEETDPFKGRVKSRKTATGPKDIPFVETPGDVPPPQKVLHDPAAFEEEVPPPSFTEDPDDYLYDFERRSLSNRDEEDFRAKHLQHVPVEQMAEVAKMGRLARPWYRHSSHVIDSLFDTLSDKLRFAHTFAGLSPVNEVPQNLEMALDLWNGWHRSGRPKTKQQLESFLHNLPRGSLEGVTSRSGFATYGNKDYPLAHWGDTLPAHKQNVIRTLSQPEGHLYHVPTLSGFKVGSFTHNIMGDPRQGTIDTWDLLIRGLKPKFINTRGGYLSAVVRHRQTAGYLNQQPGEKGSPWHTPEVQASVWTVGRWLLNRMMRDINKLPQDRWESYNPWKAVDQMTNRDVYHNDNLYLLTKEPKIRAKLLAMGLEDRLHVLDHNLRHENSYSEDYLNQPASQGLDRKLLAPFVDRIKQEALRRSFAQEAKRKGKV